MASSVTTTPMPECSMRPQRHRNEHVRRLQRQPCSNTSDFRTNFFNMVHLFAQAYSSLGHIDVNKYYRTALTAHMFLMTSAVTRIET